MKKHIRSRIYSLLDHLWTCCYRTFITSAVFILIEHPIEVYTAKYYLLLFATFFAAHIGNVLFECIAPRLLSEQNRDKTSKH